jgi:hypothetical protein
VLRRHSFPSMKRQVAIERIERKIYFVRGQKVMLDSDLAGLYGVTTGNLNLAVRRNRARFPKDFMFRLTAAESKSLLLQFAITKTTGRGGRQTQPYAFTEHGVAMLSSVLKSERAVQMSILIVRAFIRLRQILATHTDLARRLDELERKYDRHDEELQSVFEAIRQLLSPPDRAERRIGFTAGNF